MRTFESTHGIPVMTTSSAEQIGSVKHFAVEDGRITSLHIEGGKRDAQFVAWPDVTAIGDDAVTVQSADVLRDPVDEREEQAVRGDLMMLGKRVLDDMGDDHGVVSDVSFAPDDGRIESVFVGEESIAGERLLGVGSYAVVIRTAPDR